MLHRRQCEIVENRFEHVADISKAEAMALDELGKELAAPASTWSEESDDEELERESDPDHEEGQRRPSVIRVHQRPADAGWRIQVDRAIGVIGVNDLQINVVPKIPQAHFNHLAEIAIAPQRMRFGRESFKLQPDSSFLPSVWGAFLDALAVTLRADLHHDYEERTDDPPYIRGRLDVRKTSINLSRGLLRFPAVFEDLTVDNPVNRLLKAAAETVGSAAELAAPNGPSPQHDAYRNLITRAREMAYRMGDVGKLRPGDHDAAEPRLAVHQRDALQLARHILTGVGRSLTLGDVKVTCFLLPTPDLIERGVRTILDNKLAPGFSVTKRPKVAARLRFQPDLVIEVTGDPPLRPKATGDVKYRIREQDWARSTLLQVMGFAQVFASPLSVFVDFSTAGEVPLESETINDITYHHVSWPCSVDVTPEEAEQRVLSDLRKVLVTS